MMWKLQRRIFDYLPVRLTKFNSGLFVFKGLIEGFAVSKLRKSLADT